ESYKSQIINRFKNGPIAVKYLDSLIVNGLAPIRVKMMAWCTKILLSWKDKPELSKWTKDDVEFCVKKMIESDWATSTNNTFLINLQRVVSYAKQGKVIILKNNDVHSPEVSWIRPTQYRNRKKEKKITAEDLISEVELIQLVETVPQCSLNIKRDQAFLYVAREFAARPAELFNMRLGWLTFDHEKGVVYVKSTGKTGAKRWVLVLSYKPLLDFINSDHPDPSNTDAYLWTSRRGKTKKMNYSYLGPFFRQLRLKANFKKKITIYTLRYSKLTQQALEDPGVLKELGNWSTIKTADVYIRKSQENVERSILSKYGLVNEQEKNKDKVSLKKCNFCGKMASPHQKRCECGAFVDPITALKFEKARESHASKGDKKTRKEIEELRDIVLQQQKMVQEFINSQQKN
ncbi:MAG: tyrosine-type recombinase/integrase, partial [Nitrosopumilaceae archaeon]